LPSGASDIQASCGQFINLSEMFFDASHVAAGGIKIANTMGSTIGPAVFFTGFTTAGVHIDGGHECMIQQGWFAECEWSDARGSVCQEDPSAPGGNKSHSVGILIDSADNIVTDVIVFEYTHIGVEVNGPANLLQGVHTWNAGIYEGTYYVWKGGVGIAINAHQNRVVACYLDYSTLAVTDPNELVVVDSSFLGVPAVFISKEATFLQGVQMHGNTYVFLRVFDLRVHSSIQYLVNKNTPWPRAWCGNVFFFSFRSVDHIVHTLFRFSHSRNSWVLLLGTTRGVLVSIRFSSIQSSSTEPTATSPARMHRPAKRYKPPGPQRPSRTWTRL
jgi:hypothetical protein